MVREPPGGSKRSHRALERGGGARAESLLAGAVVQKRGEGSMFGAGGVGRKGAWCGPAAFAGLFVMPDLCGYESKEIVNSVRDAEGCSMALILNTTSLRGIMNTDSWWFIFV